MMIHDDDTSDMAMQQTVTPYVYRQ